MATIKVPKTPKKAFNTHRRPSALLLSQIAHLEWAARPAAQRKPELLPTPRVRTEGEAADLIAELTLKIVNTYWQSSTAPPPPDVAPAGRPVQPQQPRATPKRRRAAKRRRPPAKKGRSSPRARKRRRGR